jgi:hypothetical protein
METYAKVGVDGGVYYPLNETYQLGIGGFAAWVFPSEDIRSLPVDLRAFNGGPRSVRSFPERELGPSFGGDPYGGDFSWCVNSELSRPLTGALTAVAFLDAGAVTGNYTGIRQGGLELAAGLGHCTTTPHAADALHYTGAQDLFRTAQFHHGDFEIQDLASQLVGLAAAPAAGGNTLTLATREPAIARAE